MFPRTGLAGVDQRTVPALRAEVCRGSCAALHNSSEAGCCADRQLTKSRIERHLSAATRLSIKKSARRDWRLEHFLDAESLGAELHFVCAVTLRLPFLVLDRECEPSTIASPELDEIGNPRNTEAEASHDNTADNPHTAACFVFFGVDSIVQVVPIDGMDVLTPYALEMNQGGLPLAINDVLQRGDWKKIILGKHCLPAAREKSRAAAYVTARSTRRPEADRRDRRSLRNR
jgi:hypothetical protein